MNLKISLGLSIALAVLAVLAGAGSQFVDMGFSPVAVKAMLAAFILLLSIGNAVNAVLVGFGLTKDARLNAVNNIPTEDRIRNLVNTTDGEIKKIETTQAIANAITSEKVVGPNGH